MADDYYVYLGIERSASEADIRKAYYKKAVTCHPDRADDATREEATKEFQKLSRIYAILSDAHLKEIYDRTGSVEDGEMNDNLSGRDWEQYWRELFPRVTKKEYEAFAEKYRGSEEEHDDIIAAYESAQGDIGKVIDTVYCATIDDEERFRGIIDKAIAAGEIKAYKRFTNESTASRSKRHKAAAKEAKEAEEMLKSIKEAEKGSLAEIIRNRQQSRMDSLISSIESKYSKPTKEKKAKSAAPEISEEEFAALQEKLFKNKSSSDAPKRSRK